MTERAVDPGGIELRIDTTLAVVLVGYRFVGAAWLTILAVLTLTGDEDVRGGVVGSAIAAAWAWSLLTAWVLQTRPQRLLSPLWLLADLAVALWTLGAPLADGAPAALNFSGGYPASSVLLWAYAWKMPGGLAAASASIAVVVFSSEYSANGKVTTSLVYLVVGLVVPWGIVVLRRNEGLRLAAEADLATERAERVRSQERAEMAARVHDSVLQTLALIQKRAGDEGEVRSLARQQERRLRQTLFEAPGPGDQTFAAAMQEAAAAIEDRYRVTVEVVTVGDCPVDEPVSALVAAGNEALVNAAKFSGMDGIALYAEVGAGRAALFVRDRGRGFDPETVDQNRRGIADSIVARMERHRGTAVIRTEPGRGTEVELSIPLTGGSQ